MNRNKVIGSTVIISIIILGSVLTAGFLGYIPGWNIGQTKKIQDMFGREVVVPAHPTRVVGTGAGMLRYLVYLNATDLVCGVENIERDEQVDPTTDLRPYNLAHPELRSLPSIGPQWGGDPELILGSAPDVVFTTNYVEASELDTLQAQIGIPVVGIAYGDLDEKIDTLWAGLNLTAKVLGKEDRFIQFQGYMLSIFADLNNRTLNVTSSEMPTCYVGGVSYRGSHGLDSTKPGYDPFDFANVINVAESLGGDHQFVDKEQILLWDPEKLVIDGGGYALCEDDLASGDYGTMSAVISGEIYVTLPYSWYSYNFGNILVDAYFIGKMAYPGRFADVNLNTTAALIYSNFVGSDVFDTIMANFKTSAGTTQDALAKMGGTYSP